MVKKEKYSEKWLLKLIIVSVILLGLCFSVMPSSTNRGYVDYDRRDYCTDESRIAEMCIELYDPVCGSNGKTYSNSCFACKDSSVIFFTPGEC